MKISSANKLGNVYSHKATVQDRYKFEILTLTVTKYPLTLTQQCGTLNYSGLQFLLKVANVRRNYTVCFFGANYTNDAS